MNIIRFNFYRNKYHTKLFETTKWFLKKNMLGKNEHSSFYERNCITILKDKNYVGDNLFLIYLF